MLILDAVGLTTFAFIGAAKGIEANLGFFGAVFFAVLTPVGGGILRDIVANRAPSVFLTKDFYVGPVLISGILHYLFKDYMREPFAVTSLLIVIFAIRVAAIFLDIDFRRGLGVFDRGKVRLQKVLVFTIRTFL